MSDQARQHLDLVAAAVAGVILAIVAIAVPVTAVKAIAAVPLCLLLPGYVVSAVIFTRVNLDRSIRVMLVPAMSLVTLVLGGMLLNETPGGIRESSWAILLVVVIVGGSAIAWRLRLAEVTAGGPVRQRPIRPFPRVKPGNVLVLGLALLIAIGALAASRIHLGAKNANGYETLALAQSADGRAVKIALTSVRQHTASYRLVVKVDSTTMVTRRVTMAPGHVLNLTLELGRSKASRTVTASAVLTPGHWIPRQVDLQIPAS